MKLDHDPMLILHSGLIATDLKKLVAKLRIQKLFREKSKAGGPKAVSMFHNVGVLKTLPGEVRGHRLGFFGFVRW